MSYLRLTPGYAVDGLSYAESPDEGEDDASDIAAVSGGVALVEYGAGWAKIWVAANDCGVVMAVVTKLSKDVRDLDGASNLGASPGVDVRR